MGSSPLRAPYQAASRIPAAGGGGGGTSSSSSQQHRARGSPPQGGGDGSSRMGSPPGSSSMMSPPLGPSPTRGYSPRVSPSPRVVREQWGGSCAGVSSDMQSPRPGGEARGSSRGFRSAGRMGSLVSQSLDGALLQAGAGREQQGMGGALQQVSWVDERGVAGAGNNA